MAPKKLVRASETVFHNPDDIEQGKRPLEWRRSFNFVDLPLKDIKLITGCKVHEIDYSASFDDSEKAHPSREIIPSVADTISISGVLDDEEMRDWIYVAEKSKSNPGEYDVLQGKNPTKIVIKSGTPSAATEDRPGGIYWGNAFHYDHEPGEDCIYFDLSVPHEQMISLASALKDDKNAKLRVGAHLLSYTYEVDDALREPWHRQDIIIEDMTLCFASFVHLTSQISAVQTVARDFLDDDEQQDEQRDEATDPEFVFKKTLLQVLAAQTARTDKLINAVWALVIVVALAAIFR